MIETKKNDKTVQVTFVLPDDESLGEVSVVGEFNGWKPGATPFVNRKSEGIHATIELEKNEMYAFRYLSEGRGWLNEDEGVNYESSPFGSFNCILQT